VAIREYALGFPQERDPRVELAAFPDMVSVYRGLTSGYFPPPQAEFALIHLIFGLAAPFLSRSSGLALRLARRLGNS
jgi:hypothetical protein